MCRVEVNDGARRLLNHLANARLLIEDRGERDEPVVEVAHEALLRTWPRLQEWIVKEEGDLRLRRQIEQAARDWQNAPADQQIDYLLAGGRLREAVNWLKRYPANDLVQPLIEASSAHRAALIDQEEKRTQELHDAESASQRAAEQARIQQRRAAQRTQIALGVIGLAVLLGIVAVAL